MINSSSMDRQDPNSEIFGLESVGSGIEGSTAATASPTIAKSSQSLRAATQVETSEIKSELEALLKALKLAAPQPPNTALSQDFISETLAKIAAAEPIAHSQELLAELKITRDKLDDSRAELDSIHQRNQAQVDAVDRSVLQVKQVKFRTQQLARNSQQQIQKVQQMLESFEIFRNEIVASLDRFGGYAEIQTMLSELEGTRYALVLAHDRLKTGQEAFYESLGAIQDHVALQSRDTDDKLHSYQESIQSLTTAIATDRDKLAIMGVEMTLKLSELKGLDEQIVARHGQVVSQSQALQEKVYQIDRGFTELAASIQQEKGQLTQLSTSTIDKAEVLRSEFNEVARQISLDRDAIEHLKAEISLIRQTITLEAEQQSAHFDRQHQELMSTWSEIQVRQKHLSRHGWRFSVWLWILSLTVGVVLVLLITILMKPE